MNIGNADAFTMTKMAKTVTELTGSRPVLVREPLPVDAPCQR